MKTAEHSSVTASTGNRQPEPFFSKGGSSVDCDGQSPFFPRTHAIQPKLTIGQPNDIYEQEADAMADIVVQRLHENRQVEKLQPKQISETNSPEINTPSLETSLESAAGSGNPLPAATRERMEDYFESDFSKVRIHYDSAAADLSSMLHAQAFTHGSDIFFNSGRFNENNKEGTHLLAHELTHVLQQQSTGISGSKAPPGGKIDSKLIQRTPLPPSYAGLTGVHNSSKIVIDPVPYFLVDGLTAPLLINVRISDPLIDHMTWELYDPNDTMMSGSYSTMPGSTNSTSRPFQLEPSHFSGSGFIPGKYLLRCSGLNNRHQPVFYADREFYVFNTSLGMTQGLPADPGRPSIPAIPPTSVNAYYFPGTSQEKALVIGGVHGSEQSGIEVVEALRMLLADRSLPLPYFNTILIPVLFPDNLAYDQAYRAAHPSERGTDLAPQSGGRYPRLGSQTTDMREPNRNYPRPGTSMETALLEDTTVGGRPTTVPPPRGTTVVNQALLPETQMLLMLIEKYRPSRIASVHAHRPSNRRGDAPGIFVDPRRDDPSTAINETTEDDDLAKNMLSDARSRGLRRSNPHDDVHYRASHPTGASLGDWAPVPVDEGTPGVADRPGDRPGITTITVEVEGYSPQAEDPQMASKIRIHSETLLEVFLARP